MKKLSLVAVLASFAIAAFAQPAAPKGPDFKNKTYSGIVTLDTTNDTSKFAGVYNNTKVELLSGKVDCGIDATFGLESFLPLGADSRTLKFTEMEVNDWYIEFRPFDKITFGISDVIYTHGSYLPVLDKNISTGNIGSTIVVVWRPVAGSRISFGYGIPSFFAKNEAGEEAHPVFNFGADYTYGKVFSVGFSVRDVINNMSLGIYSEILAVEHLYVTMGYSYNDAETYYGITGENLLSLGAKYNYKNVGFNFDFATNLGNDTGADFYLGTNLTLAASKKVSLGLQFQTALEKDDVVTNVYEFKPSVSYAEKTWGFGAGVDVKIADATTIEFPVYFEFSL